MEGQGGTIRAALLHFRKLISNKIRRHGNVPIAHTNEKNDKSYFLAPFLQTSIAEKCKTRYTRSCLTDNSVELFIHSRYLFIRLSHYYTPFVILINTYFDTIS